MKIGKFKIDIKIRSVNKATFNRTVRGIPKYAKNRKYQTLYVSVPKDIVRDMELEEGEELKVMIKRVKK
jgi:hypothetical protein